MAAGIIALLLSARPDLGWRDVQYLIVRTAKVTDPKDMDWTTNGMGYRINHKYGFGNLDAAALINASLDHNMVPSPALVASVQAQAGLTIPFTGPDDYLEHMLAVSEGSVGQLKTVEQVLVTVRISHKERRYLTIRLTSPAGTESILGTERNNDMSEDGFMPWTFGTVRCWGESPLGLWRLQIADSRWASPPGSASAPGTLLSWGLTFHGVCGEHDVVLDANGRPTCTESQRLVARHRLPLAIAVSAITAAMVSVAAAWVFLRYRERRKAMQYLLVPTISPSTPSDDLESATTPSTGLSGLSGSSTSSGQRITPTFLFRTYEPPPSPTKSNASYDKKSPIDPSSPALGGSSAGSDVPGVMRFAADIGKSILHKFDGFNGGMRTNWTGEHLMVRNQKVEDEAKSPIFVPQSELRAMPSAREFASIVQGPGTTGHGLRISLDKARRDSGGANSRPPSSPIERAGSPQRRDN
jgi:subtilisin-like proprotein convertase family protein